MKDEAGRHRGPPGLPVRQVRNNALILASVLAPLVFQVCVNLVTGGSLAKAVDGSNIWALPLLAASAAIVIYYNLQEAVRRRSIDSAVKPKPFNGLRAAVPAVEAISARIALPGHPASPRGPKAESTGKPPPERGHQPQHEHEAETVPANVEALIADLWPPPGNDARTERAYKAAWSLASVMSSKQVLAAINRTKLTTHQLGESRLTWLRRPEAKTGRADDPVNIVNGRIGYLILKGARSYIPRPPLGIDPYIGIGLIAVRKHRGAYHSACTLVLHDLDADTLDEMQESLQQRRKAARGGDDGEADLTYRAWGESLHYYEIGEVIQPGLLHINPQLGRKQANLVKHVMRHFFTDNLSCVIFDALPDETQASLAARLLVAHSWMPPAAWERWIDTGRNYVYSPRLEVGSDLSFAAGGALAISIVVFACWQLVAWVSHGWSWYFGRSHILPTWPGWGKAALIAVAVIIAATWISRAPAVGITLLVIGGTLLAGVILSSPVVKFHSWVSSWVGATTVVIGMLVLAILLVWLGVFYTEERWRDVPVQLAGINARGLRIPSMDRFRPDHRSGHTEWCAVAANT